MDDKVFYGFCETLFTIVVTEIEKQKALSSAERKRIMKRLFQGVSEEITWPVQQRLFRERVVR
ncbi:MAG: hypothetical protein PQJ60_10775 [Spirochaetales bacterium]|nr:hypothetical protein [Spirochaetales bacterium]